MKLVIVVVLACIYLQVNPIAAFKASSTTTTSKTTTTTTPKTTTTTTPKTTTTTTRPTTTTTTTPTTTTTTPTTTTTTPTTTTTTPTTTTTTPTTTTPTPTTTTLCPLASSRVVIISDYPPEIPSRNCIGSCSYYPNSKYMSVSDLGLTMSDTLIVIAGPNSSPNTASSMIDNWQYIYYLGQTTKTYFFTYPIPRSGDPNGAYALSNYNILNQIPTISSAVAVEDFAAYEAGNPGGLPCCYLADVVPTTTPTTTTTTPTTTTGPTTTTAVGSCVTSTSRMVIISDYPPQIASPNCVGSCSYYSNSEYMNVFNLNLGMSDTLVIIAGPYSTPNTASSIIDYWQFIYLLGQTTNTYFFTYPIPSSGDPNGAYALSNYNILNQIPSISSAVKVEDFAADEAGNPGGLPCCYLASIGVTN